MVPSNTSRLPHGSNNATGSSEGNGENERRRQMASSNTWTSSSGDVLSDHDDIEDRGPFIQEYNRLARKVYSSTKNLDIANSSISMVYDFWLPMTWIRIM